MALLKRKKFLLECPLPMMLALLSHVLNHFGKLRPAHRERPVSILPFEATEGRERLMNPFRRSSLDHLHGPADGQSGRQAEHQMNVIVDAADLKRRHTLL